MVCIGLNNCVRKKQFFSPVKPFSQTTPPSPPPPPPPPPPPQKKKKSELPEIFLPASSVSHHNFCSPTNMYDFCLATFSYVHATVYLQAHPWRTFWKSLEYTFLKLSRSQVIAAFYGLLVTTSMVSLSTSTLFMTTCLSPTRKCRPLLSGVRRLQVASACITIHTGRVWKPL